MRPQLPLASYLFILRRHLRLVAGVFLAVLVAGWYYARSEDPVFQARAVVDIHVGSRGAADGRAPFAGEDPVFIGNQVYLIRNHVRLAERVLEHLRTPVSPAPPPKGTPGGEGRSGEGYREGPAEGGPREPARPGPEVFQGHTVASLRGRVSVSAIPGTTYYEFTVTGGDQRLNTALVNAYSRVFTEVFREDQEARFQGSMTELQEALDAHRGRLEEANAAIADYKKANTDVDLASGRLGSAREKADSLRAQQSAEQSRLQVLQREQKSVVETLAAVGLSIHRDSRVGQVLVPPPAEDPEKDPRLSERIQALDLVSRQAGVRTALTAKDTLDLELAKLLTGPGALKEDAPEIRNRRSRRSELLRTVARITEAAVLKQAQDVGRSVGVVADLAEQLEEMDRTADAEAVARAELERLQSAVAGVQADILRSNGLILDARRQRQRFQETGGSVRVLSYAQPGEAALVSPNRPVIYLGTVVLALLLAAGLAYVLEYLDDTVKTREDFDRLVRLPFLGYVPHIREDAEGGRDLVVARGRTGSPEVEAFRALRTGIQFSRPDHEVRALLVTSAGPGEGKTTVAINVASAFTGGKGRVLLVDADLRRARVHSALGVSNDRGLTNVLVGEGSLADTVQASLVPGLDILSSGPIPPNPADVLGSERMQQILRDASARYDRVIVDSPPIVAVTDPALLAKYVDAVFLVISIGKTSIRMIQRAQETLAAVGVSIHGAILNNADERTSGYGGYYGGYGYGYGYGYAARAAGAKAAEA